MFAEFAGVPKLIAHKYFDIYLLGPYQPGTPGIKWTEDQAMIIRSKILYLWQNWKNTVKDFDFGTNTATNTDYVYDKDELLSTKDCGDRGKEIL